MDIINELMKSNFDENNMIYKYLSLIVLSIIVILACIIAYNISKSIVNLILPKHIKKSQSKFDDVLLEHGFYEKLTHIVPIIIIYSVEPLFNEYSKIVNKVADSYLIIVLILLVISTLDSINESYQNYEISKTRPITAILQIVKLVIYIMAAFLLVANFMGKDPLALLGGIGALSAVFSLVFKDPILGFVGGVQLTSTDMLRVGDWINVPKYNAEGTVTEIALTTISLQAFDKTTVTIPNYSLITDSFVNYRGMQDSGGRRIKRVFYFDISTIKFCSKENIEKFKQIDYLNDYIIKRQDKIRTSNPKLNLTDEEIIREMGITNLEIMRTCAKDYMENHPEIRKDYSIMVRQFPPEDKGMPIEIYAFADTTIWANFEGVQAEITDRICYLATKFDLKLFQKPSGRDVMHLISNKE